MQVGCFIKHCELHTQDAPIV